MDWWTSSTARASFSSTIRRISAGGSGKCWTPRGQVTAVASSGDPLAALGGAAFDVLRSIRGGAVAGSVAIRSIAMTAHADAETRQKALEAGFDDFLPKLVGALLVPAVARLREPT